MKPISLCFKIRYRSAFSLVEVTLAMGLMSFALVALMGLLPVGMTTFHNATDSSTGTQIAQRLINEAQQTDFDQLIATPQVNRFFDVQGNELTPADKGKAIYDTNLLVSNSTTLPGAGSNPDLATISLQIANNPGRKTVATESDNHWKASAGLTISFYAANVARNK